MTNTKWATGGRHHHTTAAAAAHVVVVVIIKRTMAIATKDALDIVICCTACWW